MMKKIFRHIILIILSIITFFPLLWMISNSFKTTESIMRKPLSFVPDFLDFRNFAGALNLAPFDLYIINSIVTSIIIVILQIITGVLLAYGMYRFSFKARGVLFKSILLTYMLPAATTYVPSYVIIAKMGLIDTLTGIIISNAVAVFTIYMLYNTFKEVPKELIEAAEMDGASDRDILLKVILPISKSTILTSALIQFVTMYNNYMWPSLITNSKSKYLISVGLNKFFTSQGNFGENLPLLMAGNTISVLPLLILFVVLQKWFIKGISDSGIKG
ncbi:MAG: carbohydrate ABC transporter permease [Peptoniphilus rhinitidis]|uniref:carbohydrate ABC transporter permease n=2 Tax=Peptoniphilus rhinitidis TaxID=1175452 RepID=UPI002902E324|nr:carbohydrate ABC transporter permease [Peptoniphilus rhinitidis]MDU2109188.1 carbohydrate ABC transporter permease [Peptoniphilus lacydonensis]MDU3750193.1 carbohydrate ABC transporter permease [Peptoniphilus rhinitidis]